MATNPPPRRITIIPFIHGKRTSDGKVSEPDIYFILQKWLDRHPEFQERAKEFRISRGRMYLPDGMETELVLVTADFSTDLAEYDPNQDADLYEYFLSEIAVD